MTAIIDYLPCATARMQPGDERLSPSDELLDELSARYPAPWDDAAPVAELDVDVTARLEIPPDRRNTGEHPAWTAGIARAKAQLEARIQGPKTEDER